METPPSLVRSNSATITTDGWPVENIMNWSKKKLEEKGQQTPKNKVKQKPWIDVQPTRFRREASEGTLLESALKDHPLAGLRLKELPIKSTTDHQLMLRPHRFRPYAAWANRFQPRAMQPRASDEDADDDEAPLPPIIEQPSNSMDAFLPTPRSARPSSATSARRVPTCKRWRRRRHTATRLR